MNQDERTLVTYGGLKVVGTIERLVWDGHELDCTRSLETINDGLEAVIVRSVTLRAAGTFAAERPPYMYTLSRVIPAGERAPVLDVDVFRQVGREPQAPGAVDPFKDHLLASGWEAELFPQVTLQLRQETGLVDVGVPVLQLASDERGRLFHVGTPGQLQNRGRRRKVAATGSERE